MVMHKSRPMRNYGAWSNTSAEEIRLVTFSQQTPFSAQSDQPYMTQTQIMTPDHTGDSMSLSYGKF